MLHKDGVFRWMLTRGLMISDESGSASSDGGIADRHHGRQGGRPDDRPAQPLLFLDRLSRVIARVRRHPESMFAVLFLDLDGFKLVNDSLGHAVGDKLLVQVAKRLEGSLRQSDTVARLDEGFTIARLGGDEFAIVLNDVNDPVDANVVAKRLINEFSRPFLIDDKELFSSLSIGIALSSLGYQDPEDYLRDADTAMYRAKAHGKGRYEVFDTDMRNLITRRLEVENDLRRALERDEFRNYYQPIISLESGTIVSFEALLRWEHPTRGLLEPLEFIPIAEESGMIRELGLVGARRGMPADRVVADAAPDPHTLAMCVNLSVKQFMDPSFGTKLEALLRQVQLPEGTLKLELTESSLMGDSAAAVTLLSQVKALGVRLAIDDFGTGYSSLSYLHRFPLDTLKIDRSFTDAIRTDPKNESMIARTIMPLAQHLGLDVVAEGVETIEQATMLKQLHCKYAQGFLFSRPVKAEDVLTLLAQSVDGISLAPNGLAIS